MRFNFLNTQPVFELVRDLIVVEGLRLFQKIFGTFLAIVLFGGCISIDGARMAQRDHFLWRLETEGPGVQKRAGFFPAIIGGLRSIIQLGPQLISIQMDNSQDVPVTIIIAEASFIDTENQHHRLAIFEPQGYVLDRLDGFIGQTRTEDIVVMPGERVQVNFVRLSDIKDFHSDRVWIMPGVCRECLQQSAESFAYSAKFRKTRPTQTHLKNWSAYEAWGNKNREQLIGKSIGLGFGLRVGGKYSYEKMELRIVSFDKLYSVPPEQPGPKWDLPQPGVQW